MDHALLWMVLSFSIGYLAIIFEHPLKINKTASALLMAVITWGILFVSHAHADPLHALGEHLSSVSQIIFFLLGAMTLVELIDSHKGFGAITDLIHTNSKRKMLWILGFIAFFLSAVLDNLTTTIVIISLLRKLISDTKERLALGAMIVIAANAGGAWTPIGDITTTMLWIGGKITTLEAMKMLFLPSLLSFIAALWLIGRKLKGSYARLVQKASQEHPEPGSRIVFYTGLAGLIFVPIFKSLTGLPPFMGILLAVGALWVLTDRLHHGQENREHLLIPHILSRIDTTGVLFFFGILLAIGALDSAGLLRMLAEGMSAHFHSITGITTLIGLASAVIDNVPLVAAGMGMYDYPVNHPFWQMLAYCAGTGGSILIIGSAAGIAFMGMEKISFGWYFRKISSIALMSYLFGILVYLVQEALLFR